MVQCVCEVDRTEAAQPRWLQRLGDGLPGGGDECRASGCPLAVEGAVAQSEVYLGSWQGTRLLFWAGARKRHRKVRDNAIHWNISTQAIVQTS
jgi:hypothetical protein